MPPLVVAVLGVAGGVTLAGLILKEARRVNAILHPDRADPHPAAEAESDKPPGPKLRKDATGVYRPG